MQKYTVDERGYYGDFGGAYIPEILHKCVTELEKAYQEIIESETFQNDFNQLLRDYVGRPSPLYYSKQLSERYGAKIYLKREDLNHTGAHKINNTIGQILIAREMGKTRIIAETGAGQLFRAGASRHPGAPGRDRGDATTDGRTATRRSSAADTRRPSGRLRNGRSVRIG